MHWNSEYASCFSRKNAASEGCACIADMEVENVEELFVSLQLTDLKKSAKIIKMILDWNHPNLNCQLGELWYPSQL